MTELRFISSLEKVLPDVRPTLEKSSGVMLKNEKYHFSFFLHSDENWPSVFPVRLKVESDLGDVIHVYRTALVPAVFTGVESDDMYCLNQNRPGLYPDCLIEGENDIALPPHQYVGFIVEVAPKGQKCLPVGEHTIRITALKEDTEVASGDFHLEILNEKLAEHDLAITQWIHYDSMARVHGVKVFSRAFYRICREYFQTAVRYGQTMVLTPLFTFPLDTAVGGKREPFQLVGVSKVGEEYRFDFSELKHFIDFAFSCGFRYIEFSHLFTQWGAYHAPAVYGDDNGTQKQLFGWDTDALGDDYKAFLTAFLPALVAFIDKEGLRGKCYLHISDEPNETHLEHYRKVSAFVRGLIDGLPLMDALSHYQFYEEKLTDLAAVCIDQDKLFREHNTRHLVYYCCFPTTSGYPNRTMTLPLHRVRILGSLIYRNDAVGFLQWGFNFYQSAYSIRPIDPYNNTDSFGNFPSGDAFVVYPNGDSVRPSLRLLAFYDGFQDYMALKRLEQKRGREFVLSFLENNGIKEGYNDYPRNPGAFESMRETIARLLVAKK